MNNNQQAVQVMEKELEKLRKDVTSMEVKFAFELTQLTFKLNHLSNTNTECIVTDIQTYLDTMKKLDHDIRITNNNIQSYEMVVGKIENIG